MPICRKCGRSYAVISGQDNGLCASCTYDRLDEKEKSGYQYQGGILVRGFRGSSS